MDLEQQLQTHQQLMSTQAEERRGEGKMAERARGIGGRRVAVSYQRFLLLSLFAAVPDRQRTFRELAVGITLRREGTGQWVIKHGPEDYKTGECVCVGLLG